MMQSLFDQQNFSDFIKENVRRKHITLKQLAKRAGIGYNTVLNYVNCVSVPSVLNFEAVVNVFGYSVLVVSDEQK